jgi:hypothetical protein
VSAIRSKIACTKRVGDGRPRADVAGARHACTRAQSESNHRHSERTQTATRLNDVVSVGDCIRDPDFVGLRRFSPAKKLDSLLFIVAEFLETGIFAQRVPHRVETKIGYGDSARNFKQMRKGGDRRI